ncbi:MAG TPA: hypothetical protein VF589_08550 [Allosphingosinicella sp.]|jgi:DNA-binding transcriptional LysR family regulator
MRMRHLEEMAIFARVGDLGSISGAELLRSGDFLHVLPAYKLVDQPTVYALYAGRTALSPKIGVFLDFLSELAAKVPARPDTS